MSPFPPSTTAASPALQDAIGDVGDLTDEMATMPGAGMGGPLPTPATSGTDLITEAILGAEGAILEELNDCPEEEEEDNGSDEE